MESDLTKPPETKDFNDAVTQSGLLYVMNHDARALRHWIEGFR